MLLLAEILFSIGLVKAAEISIYTAIDRMGSDRPQTLIRSEEGWEVDSNKSFEQYPFIGEVQCSRPEKKTTDDMWLPFCGCCSSVTVVDLLMGNTINSTAKASSTPQPSRSFSRAEDLDSTLA